MEDDTGQYSLSNLGNYSYRYLQKMAKSMGLPSNVKKIYIVELINAHKFKSSRELNDIIHRVKLERKQLARKKKVKKMRLQGAEITSTSNSSPPISQTPKRKSLILTRSPDRKTIAKPNPENRLYSSSLKTYPSNTRSDRVLRSFRDRPNYRIMNASNTVFGVIKAQSPKTKINIVSQDGSRPKLNVTAFVKKQSNESSTDRQLVSYPLSLVTSSEKRQKRISGISLLTMPEELPKFTPTLHFTRQDGRMSTINALVQKQLPPQICYRERNPVTVPNTYKVDEQTTQNVLTENNSCFSNQLTELIQEKSKNTNNIYAINDKNQDIRNMEDCTEYYHKKIRAEHVRSVKVTQMGTVEERLPCINEVFSKFSDLNLRNLMQPIHVEVSEESERTINLPTYMPRINIPHNGLLECVYNFRTQFMTNQPLLQIAPKAKTKSVYSTPTISSAMQQPTTAMIVDDYNALYMRDNLYEEMVATPVTDYARVETLAPFKRDFSCNEVLSSSSSSSESSGQDLGANVTIPEMVEDALELISQDGDYMERIGMDVRMQCVLCDWAGPKFILEHHIRKEHVDSLQYAEDAGGAGVEGGGVGGGGGWCAWWCVRAALRALRAGRRVRRVLARGSELLLLTAHYRHPVFTASLHTLTSDGEAPRYGKITIYNKVTGEPYIWEGDIQEFTDASGEDNTNCLQIELSKINLLPNSANLMLIDRELVLKSPTKVVVGSHPLEDIDIVMFVQYQ